MLTDTARVRAGTHTYDDLANAALRWIAEHGGDDAVARVRRRAGRRARVPLPRGHGRRR